MAHDETGRRTAPRDTTAGTAAFGRLSELDDYKVADGYPDINGWDVKTTDGTKVGEVKDLVVDTQAMRVRYLDVELDRSLRQVARDATTPGDQSDDRHVLLPIGDLRLDDDHDDVLVDNLTAAQIGALPRHGGMITSDYESRLRAGLVGGAAAGGAVSGGALGKTSGTTGAATAGSAASSDRFDYDADDYRNRYDDQRLFAGRRARTAGTADRETERMTLSEERLDVDKRQVQAGEVSVRKSVETEHVREQVPLRHEEVTIERHPISADAGATASANIGADEIRVPVMKEEAVVQKRVVPREEIIIRKHAVQGEQTVDADLRRERVDVDRDDVTRRGVGGAGTAPATGRTAAGGVADRLADAADDVKDRVDGNPASRPGPDATDRPSR